MAAASGRPQPGAWPSIRGRTVICLRATLLADCALISDHILNGRSSAGNFKSASGLCDAGAGIACPETLSRVAATDLPKDRCCSSRQANASGAAVVCRFFARCWKLSLGYCQQTSVATLLFCSLSRLIAPMARSKRIEGSGTAVPITGKIRWVVIIGDGELLRKATSNLGSPSNIVPTVQVDACYPEFGVAITQLFCNRARPARYR